MSISNGYVLEQIRARVAKTLTHGIQLNMSTNESKKLLKRHVNRKTKVVVMIIDVNNSTEMSLSLTEDRFALLIQIFAQEISIALTGYGGYVFKYEGDAVIALFPGEYDQVRACKNALNCTTSILEIIREVINPALKENGLPEIRLRIGLTYGYSLVVLYGNSLEKAHIDIIGSSISLASKITSIAKPNQVLVGESIYRILKSSESTSISEFIEINLDPTKWKYLSHSDPESMYRVYEYTIC
jgi:class 3 adenylate cyclase